MPPLRTGVLIEEQVQLEGGRTLTSGRLAHILGQATALRLVVVTLGDRIGPEVRRFVEAALFGINRLRAD